ncbi:MAG: creatininase family protein [Chloroflexi bacterium]|nr:creatininase family protein [Chloroflexota bacterium]
MKWHEMTGPEVHELAKTTDLAVLPIGSLETHGPHLPNGSDSFIAERVCELIAEEVPCIVLPTLYYNICAQMKSFPGGAISIPPQVMIQLYDAIFSECARLGFRKIFAAVCHGGSETPVEFLANMVHERATSEVPGKPAKPDYYLFSKTLSPGVAAAKYAKDPVLEVGHGGEIETALNMACRPDLVHMDRVTEDGPTNPRAVSANYHIEWINQVPLAYVGNPHYASLDTADKIMEAVAADFIQAAKEIAAYEIGVDV